MIVSIEMINKRIALINRERNIDLILNHNAGGYRIESHNGGRDVSPRISKKELVAWLEGFFACMYKQY